MEDLGYKIAIFIILANTLVSLCIAFVALFQKKGKKSTVFMLSWFVFIVPLFGGLYILAGWLVNHLKRKQVVDMRDVSFSQDREEQILPPDVETEMNYTPIRDAMAVSHKANLRELLLNVLRINAKRTILGISQAMNSEDTETSHYAASFMLDVLSEFRIVIHTMIKEMEKHPEDAEMNLLTLEYMQKVLDLKVMNEIEQRSYVNIMDDVAENLFVNNLWYMTATHYLWLVDLAISSMDYELAEKWVRRAGSYRPNILDTYKAHLHLYFAQERYEEFFSSLEEIQHSDLTVDDEILNLFRFYGDKLALISHGV